MEQIRLRNGKVIPVTKLTASKMVKAGMGEVVKRKEIKEEVKEEPQEKERKAAPQTKERKAKPQTKNQKNVNSGS